MDIDIDFKTTFQAAELFTNAVQASMTKDQKLVKHPAGMYFQTMPVDQVTNLAAIPYKEAEDLGFLKIDFLHLSMLDHFETKAEIRALIKVEPEWFLLRSAATVSKLFQLHKHFDLVDQVRPQSVIELADCVALIRPGKRYLLDGYLKNRDIVRKELYTKPDSGKIWFKKGHAISYALTIVLQLHLIKQKVL